jgi:hypothetical protein
MLKCKLYELNKLRMESWKTSGSQSGDQGQAVCWTAGS